MAFAKRNLLLGIIILILIIPTALAAFKTFTVQETDLVKLEPRAIDEDGDLITYYYSSPLDENGRWQTTYEDSGEYLVDVRASDGLKETKEQVKIIVQNKNQAPYLKENKVTVKETQELDLKTLTQDPDNDPLEFTFEVPFNNQGTWTPGYNDQGRIVTTFTMSDGEFKVPATVEVNVENTNQPPQITTTFSTDTIILGEEDSIITFFAEVQDSDGDQLRYKWRFDGEVIAEESKGQYYLNYDSSGEHKLSLAVQDGTHKTEQEWKVIVENKNRRPTINLLPKVANEGETITIDLPQTDEDGDKLTYSFQDKFSQEGVWNTNYNDAGDHTIVIEFSDGTITDSTTLQVTINDVDRKPQLTLPDQFTFTEGELSEFILSTEDPDGDQTTVTFEGLPEGALYDQETKQLSWEPEYEFIKRKGGFVSNTLNRLRLEHFFLRKKSFPVTVKSCGKDLCTSAKTKAVVFNVNRAPVFTSPLEATFSETDIVSLKPTFTDPDGDLVRLRFSNPVGKKNGKWKTNYDDEGRYDVYVSVTDGKRTTTKPLALTVAKKNRAPKMKIKDNSLSVKEGGQVSFKVTAKDKDKDNLTISVKELPKGASFKDGIFTWKPGYETITNTTLDVDSTIASPEFLNKRDDPRKVTKTLLFTTSDGTDEVQEEVKVTVKDTNRAPEIITATPIDQLTVKTGEPVEFFVAAQDPDGDALSYKWKFGIRDDSVWNTDTIERVFVGPGRKSVVIEVNDGKLSKEHKFIVNVVQGEKVPIAFNQNQPIQPTNQAGNLQLHYVES